MWDAFISHAWEDKEDIARPLAEALRRAGLRIWYDEFTLTLGDSLRRSIDRGLAQSRYGVVILSPAFFAKEWPQRELDGLVAREVSSGKTILPVWHNVTREDVCRFSPTLADKLAVSTAKGLDAVVEEILRALRVELEDVVGEEHRPGPPSVAKKPIVGKVAPPLAEPAVVVEKKDVAAGAPPAPRAVPRKAFLGGGVLVGGLVLLCIIGGLIFFLSKYVLTGPAQTPTSVQGTTAPVDTPAPTPAARPTATPVPSPTPTEIVPPPTIYAARTRAKDRAAQVYIPIEHGFGGFWIDKTEITTRQYDLCIQAGVCDFQHYRKEDNYPAILNGYAAQDYCTWAGARLPTRDEWLRAATGTDGRIWPWGNEWDSNKANTSDGYDGDGLLPVGRFPAGASPYGVLDMAGNAYEWVIDPTCDENEGFRLQGAGSYASDPEDFAPSTSRCLHPSTFWANTSARCVGGSE